MAAELHELPLQDKHARGVECSREGRFQEAAALLAEALSEGEECERWNDWATVQAAMRNLANAEVGFRRALQLQPENAEARVNLGVLLAQMGRSTEALGLLNASNTPAEPDAAELLTRLLRSCREQAATQLSNDSAGDRATERIARAIARQTASLSSALLRLSALESRLGVPSPVSLSAEKATPLKIPTISSETILTGATPLDLLALSPTEENVSLHELCVLAALVRTQAASGVFEFGTADGRTTMNLAANCGELGRVWTLNIPRPGLGERFANSPLRGKITQLIGNSAQFDFSPYAGVADLVFIDANHDYEYVLSDSRAALGLLRDGGVVVWHDYIPHWRGVVEGLEHLFSIDPVWSNMRHIESTSLVVAHIGSSVPSKEQAA